MYPKPAMYAQGKRDIFVPYRDRSGLFVLYSKNKSRRTGDPIHHASNKERVVSLEEAKRRVRQGTHHIRLIGRDSRQRNVFAPGKVKVC